MYKSNNQSGNVLFLILIAVALFAALSYAVTQSTRGGGNADDETSLISSASLTQYPASLKLSMLRLSISNGVSGLNTEFNAPSELGACSSSGANCLFHPDGGGASYQDAPANLVIGAAPVAWVFNSNNHVLDIGTNGFLETAVETIAFLTGLTENTCRTINEELGIGSVIPVEATVQSFTRQINGYIQASSGRIGANPVLYGQHFGCFYNPFIEQYIYYHVLSEQ